jgi:hypothetical protein
VDALVFKIDASLFESCVPCVLDVVRGQFNCGWGIFASWGTLRSAISDGVVIRGA